MAGKKVSFGPDEKKPAPKSGVVVCAGSKSGRTESSELVKMTTKTVYEKHVVVEEMYKKHGGGGSSKVTQPHKVRESVDKGNGNKVSQEVVKRESAVKAAAAAAAAAIHSSDNSSKIARAAAAPKPSATSK